MNKSVIIIPTYNEAENIAALIPRIRQFVSTADILVIDDQSPDGTGHVVERLGIEQPGLQCGVHRRTGQRGLGRAYREGFAVALERGYERIVQMDADFSHDPSYLPAMLAESCKADLVIGSRYCRDGGVRDWPLRRRMLSRFAVVYVQQIARIRIADATAGFRCWTRAGLAAVDLQTIRSEGYAFQVEMSYRAERAGLRIREIPIIFTDRTHGQSKISRRVLVESMVMPWRFRMMKWQPPQPTAQAQPMPAAVEVSTPEPAASAAGEDR